ncbi:hypothetical protein IMSAG185_01026 [Lachnospiraceae bacterium]|mgnify:CR=1 FL=1|nr:hypothetical protein [Lachnospiraceae bacterium]GFI65427.1 hypothetical protein IMSAG185_01026 [Lachnospiraceae bacterium]
MTEEDIAVKLEGHEHEIGSLKHRVGDLEKESHTISELVLAVNRMAVSMEHMLEEQKKQGERLGVLEQIPLNTGRKVKEAVISTMVGAVVGAIAAALISLL